MPLIISFVIAFLVAAILVYVASRKTRDMLPALELPDGEKLPRAPMQKLAMGIFLGVSLLTAAATILVAYHGPQVWWDSDPVRLTVTFLLIAGLVVYLGFSITVRAWEQRDDGKLDERDLAILGRASAGVGGAMMVVMAVWMVSLTEAYHDTHLVPSYYLYLIFWSVVMTNVLASLAGILISYWTR